MIKFLVWNCQGIGNKNTLSVCKELIRVNEPHILVLLEPKIADDKANKICSQLGFADSWGLGILWSYLDAL